MVSSKNHYARLELPKDASTEEIRNAYFEAARRLHPDTSTETNDAELFLEVQEAYEVLSSIDRRRAYNNSLPSREIISPSISISTMYSRSALPTAMDSQLIYAMIELTSIPDPNVTASPPLNLCLVLDRSTSMKGARMEMVKNNAIQLLRQMRPQDLISVVTFSDWAEVLIPATRISDIRKLEARINQIQTGGGTEILHGLEEGIAQIKTNMSSSFINHLILLTDGRTYGDESACIEITAEAAEQGIGMSGLGIGNEWNDTFLDNLASVSGGTSTFINAPNDLHNFLEQKYNALGRIYAERVTLDFDLGENVELRYAFRLQPDVGVLQTTTPMRIGNLIQFNSLTVLLELLIKCTPEREDDFNLLKGAFKMDIPTRLIPKVRVKLDLNRPVFPDVDPEMPPHPIIQAMSRLTLYRIQEKARQEVQAGEIQKATRHLQFLATHLLSQGERELAQTVLMEADHVHRNQQFSRDGEKRIKYGTRALLLPSGPENKRW